MSRAGLFWRTVRHLTLRQITYQVLARLRGLVRPARVRLRLPDVVPTGYFLTVPDADKPLSRVGRRFLFLNQAVQMMVIDWNYAAYGKLWTYNLNYFDFLNQPSVDAPGLATDEGLRLIHDFMAQTNRLKDGLEPYPTSLRIMNWVQFLSRNQIQDHAVNRHLYAQTSLLRRRLEYHTAGNHLLENGFALLTVALYFRHETWFEQAAKLVRVELSGQILTDGGHDERSPMYHQLLLDRLLTILLAMRYDTWHTDSILTNFLEETAGRMLGWLNTVTFRNGDVPMLNDSAPGIALTTAQLRAKAALLGLVGKLCGWSVPRFSQVPNMTAGLGTGYRKFSFLRYEMVTDVGAIGPDHQPGHGHADTLSFVLHVDNQPVIVDSGTSTYEIGPRRDWERSTAAHNTVAVRDLNSSEVWAGFRVGRRAQTTVLTHTETSLTACHDGYRHLGISHERTWLAGPLRIQITDRLTSSTATESQNQPGVARLHFHPDVPVSLIGMGINAGVMRITFVSESTPKLRLVPYEMADGFNRLRPGLCAEIAFTNQLETLLIPTE